MNTTNPPTTPAIPAVRDLTPRPGQSADEIKEWMRARARSNPGAISMLYRDYYGELVKTRPTKDNGDPAYHAWYASLTPAQKKAGEIAKQQKDADPKVQAQRKREAERDKQRRAVDPEYQAALAKKRVDYASRKGSPARAYRKGADALAPKEWAKRSRASVREELMMGRNPYPADKYDGRPDCEIKQDTRDRHMTRHVVCQHFLDSTSIDMSNKAEVVDLIGKVRAVTVTPPGDDDDIYALSLTLGALETLRTAKALQKKGDVYRLHAEIAAMRNSADLEQMKDIPGFGMF